MWNRCDLLLIGVDAIHKGFGTDDAAPILDLAPVQGRALEMHDGSMGPKLKAACYFAETGGLSGIGCLADAMAILDGSAGTRVVQKLICDMNTADIVADKALNTGRIAGVSGC